MVLVKVGVFRLALQAARALQTSAVLRAETCKSELALAFHVGLIAGLQHISNNWTERARQLAEEAVRFDLSGDAAKAQNARQGEISARVLADIPLAKAGHLTHRMGEGK